MFDMSCYSFGKIFSINFLWYLRLTLNSTIFIELSYERFNIFFASLRLPSYNLYNHKFKFYVMNMYLIFLLINTFELIVAVDTVFKYVDTVSSHSSSNNNINTINTNAFIATILTDQALVGDHRVTVDTIVAAESGDVGGYASNSLADIEWNALHDLYSMTNGQKWLWRKNHHHQYGEIWNFTYEGINKSC